MAQSSYFSIWLSTARPKTLPLALASILVGSALAYRYGQFDSVITILALLTTTLLQILSNFANDYGDHISGADTQERIGPKRAIQHGMITGAQLKTALYVVGILGFSVGVVLISYAYQSLQDLLIFLGLGVIAIVAAITYTVGKKPYGYLGLGDISVLIFFGFLAVLGTFYLQAHFISSVLFLPAFGCGLLSVAVLNINNLRDIEQDRKAGKNTLVVRIGQQNGKRYHLALLVGSLCAYLLFGLIAFEHWYQFMFLLALPLLFKHGRIVYLHQQPESLRPLLGQMAGLALVTNLLFSVGLILS